MDYVMSAYISELAVGTTVNRRIKLGARPPHCTGTYRVSRTKDLVPCHVRSDQVQHSAHLLSCLCSFSLVSLREFQNPDIIFVIVTDRPSWASADGLPSSSHPTRPSKRSGSALCMNRR